MRVERMNLANRATVMLVLVLIASLARAADGPKPAELLDGLKREAKVAQEDLNLVLKSPAPQAKKREAFSNRRAKAVDLARRALLLAKLYPDSAEAPEALVWIHFGVSGGNTGGMTAECDAAYDLLASRYLDREIILPVCRRAWHDSENTHAEAFLRAAADRSPDVQVRALACYCLALRQQELTQLVRLLDDPIRGQAFQKRLGSERASQLGKLDSVQIMREAEKLFERTVREYPALQPLGKDKPPLGELAEGKLFQVRNLEIGCTVPEIEAEDVDGKPLKLSDFRGKVVVISFWATWCGPCMAEVPNEKALVERMKGRPFVLVGVNGDKDRDNAQSVSTKEGITWRSFWNQSPNGPISLRWGVNSWPTVYVIDANGVIRHTELRGADLDRAVELLVAKAEAKHS
jgi:thiol-disulfide isomerase/thioredoxin